MAANDLVFRAIVEGSSDAMFIHAADLREPTILWANAAMAELLGCATAAELVGTAATAFVHTDRWVRRDGASRHVSRTSRDIAFGDVPAVLVIARDVTEVVERGVSESRRVEEQLRQSQKMDAIGQLAGGVAHDFNNLLAVILSTTTFVREDLGEDHRLVADIAEIESAAQRAADLTRQLLAFSRKQPHTPTLLSLGTVVARVHKLLRRIVGEDIEISSRLAPQLGAVWADAGQIEQVIMNLAVNARDAMPGGGRLAIETADVELDESSAARVGVTAGPHVVLAVSDTGCGMDETIRRRIFEPFFTTKEVGRGTGLGLATVFGIVKQSGGGITVESEPGRGSTFRVYLPRTDASAHMSTNARTAADTRRGSETILLVEDDAMLRRVIHRQLRSFGYHTLEAHDAASALDAIDASSPIDLLLTDLVMPGLDGRALATRMIDARPDVKVLYMSGYSEGATITSTVLAPGDHFIEKPFTAVDLSHAIRRALEGERSR